VVGALLRELSDNAQIISVTHQPQVAAKAQHHYRVQKQVQGESTNTQMLVLDTKGRIDEIARMLGGIEMTEATTEHAREMLNAS